MAAAIQFTVPDNDFIELTGAGASGSIFHQGGDNDVGSTVILVESAIKPSFNPSDPNRFKSNPVSASVPVGVLKLYSNAIAIWAVSSSGNQLITVTPA